VRLQVIGEREPRRLAELRQNVRRIQTSKLLAL